MNIFLVWNSEVPNWKMIFMDLHRGPFSIEVLSLMINSMLILDISSRVLTN